jgi:PAS domain S-box-containing protein
VKNGDITKEELLNEIMELRQRNAELEKSGLQCRQVESKLRDSEKLYRALYDENPSIYFTVDAGGKILSINNFGAEQLGYKVGELIGQSVFEVIYEDDKKILLRQIAECLQEPGHIATKELRKVRKDGSLLWVKEVARALSVADGNIVLIVCEDITERKRAEEELRKSEARYQNLIENARDVIFTVSLDRKITFLNPAFETITGWRREGWLGEDFTLLIHPDDIHITDEIYQRVLNGEIPPGFELHILLKSGDYITAEFVITPQTQDGKIVGGWGIARDITKRKRAEEALLQSEEKYRILVDNIQDGVFLLQDTKFQFVNEAAARMVGYTAEEIIGKDFREFVAPEHLEMVVDNYYRRLAGENVPREYEFCELHKDGKTRIYINMTVGLINYHGRVASIGTLKDITERKRMEKELRTAYDELEMRVRERTAELAEANELLKTEISEHKQAEERIRFQTIVLSQVNDAVVAFDNNHYIVYWNNGAERLYNFKSEEVLGRRMEEVTRHRWLKPEDEIIAYDSLAETGSWRGEFIQARRNGEELRVEASITTLKNEKGAAIGFISVMRDITERKRVEEERERWTAELARSNAELEQFAYVASHDLKEPLRMVSSFAQLLEKRYKGRLGKDADEFIAYIVEGTTRMLAIINDLLAYSRVGTRGKPFEPTDFESVFNQAMINLKVAIEQSGAVVTHDILPTVTADTSQMIQLLQNLISNAIKFRGKELPRVHIHAEKKGNEWVFSVQDNGIGIAPEFFGRLFQIFQRGHPASEYAGTGIGLATCKKIVERHGGKIWAESVEGKGSTFYFTIPMRN